MCAAQKQKTEKEKDANPLVIQTTPSPNITPLVHANQTVRPHKQTSTPPNQTKTHSTATTNQPTPQPPTQPPPHPSTTNPHTNHHFPQIATGVFATLTPRKAALEAQLVPEMLATDLAEYLVRKVKKR